MNTTMTEFPVDPDTDVEGLGNLFIADARLLIRPARPGQYPASVRHDSVYAYRILNLGNDMGLYDWHIISQSDPEITSRLLGQVFYAYVDACCFELWCEARVDYIVDGETVRVERYGFEDGEYMMFFNVHCNVVEDDFMVTLMDKYVGRPVVAIRPDSSERGYEARGFIVNQFLGDDHEDERVAKTRQAWHQHDVEMSGYDY